MPEIAAHCSARERVATEAEREVVNLHKTEYLARRVGETAAGFITDQASEIQAGERSSSLIGVKGSIWMP